ncbi:MAG TPA: serine hydrolase [Candidatus Saccharimonadales bacterium]|nr:serine hydrolase [Candidatus Saccharimonadales bacterium]
MVRWLGAVAPTADHTPARSKQTSRPVKAQPASIFEVKLLATLAFLVVPVVAVFLGYRIDNSPKLVVAPKAAPAEVVAHQEAPAPSPPVDPYPTLVSDMNTAIAAYPGLSGSATLIDLDAGKEYDAGNYTGTYEAASTSKLVAVFDYIHQVELGKATLTQSIQGQQAQDIIMRMIVYSDNDAWDKLNGHLKFAGEQAYLASIGVDGHMVPNNIQFSTPAMAKMLQLLYQGKLMNADHQAMIYNYMSHTTVKNLIQAALPADATVYHKYGQIDGVLHDASIVQYQGHNFVLVIYTNNAAGTAGLYSTQVNLIHAVTTAAFTDITKS